MFNVLEDSFQYLIRGGIILIPIGIICFFIWYYFLSMNNKLNESLNVRSELDDGIQEKIVQNAAWNDIKQYADLYNTFFRNIIIYSIDKLKAGIAVADIFDEIHIKEFSPYIRNFMLLKVFVIAAPLLGLLGTIWGMVDTFQVISQKAAYSSDWMASGISKALITTQFGLIVALPGMFSIMVLKRKFKQLEVRFFALEFHISLGLRRRS